MDYLLAHWHEIAYGFLALIFVAIYIIHLLPGLKASKAMEELLHHETLLIVVLMFVAITAIRTEKIADMVETNTSEIVHTLDDVLKNERLARVEPADNINELFARMNLARQRTTREIRMLRLWGESPEDLSLRSSQASIWYGEMDNWLQGGPGRILYRIIGVHDPATEAIFQQQCAAASAMRGGRVIRRVDGFLQDPDLSIVLFDQEEVFLIVSPTGDLIEATRAYSIKDQPFAGFMVEMFNHLMARAEGCP